MFNIIVKHSFYFFSINLFLVILSRIRGFSNYATIISSIFLVLVALTNVVIKGQYQFGDIFSLSFESRLVFFLTCLGTILSHLINLGSRNSSVSSVVLNFVLLFGFFALGSNDIFTIVLCIEGIVISQFVYVGLSKLHDNWQQALKAFTLSSFCFLFTLLSLILIYSSSSGLNLIDRNIDNYTLFSFGFVLLIFSGLAKIASFPFHLSLPGLFSKVDKFAAVPVVLLSKFLIFCGFYRIYTVLAIDVPPDHFRALFLIISAISIAGVVYGSLQAFISKNIRLILSFITISNVSTASGFLALNPSGESFESLIYYLFYHLLAAAGCLFLYEVLSSSDGYNRENFKGAAIYNRYIGVLLIVMLMSMVGLPVTAGFSSRLMLFTHYFNENMEFVVVVYLTANILNLFTIHNLISDLFAQDHHKTFKTVNLSGKIVPFLIFLVLISAGLNPRVFSY